MAAHTGTRQLKIVWNLIQENSEDNYDFSSAEKRALNTLTHRTLLRQENPRVFASLRI